MLKEALDFIRLELNHANPHPVTPMDFAIFGNIAQYETSSDASNSNLRDKVVITVVNFEEEKTLKNEPHYIRVGETVQKQNPPLYLNLYVLFSCTHEHDRGTYLDKLDRVIGFFQQQHFFTAANKNINEAFPEGVEKIILDMFSLNFEQVNHLWGIMGGKYFPSVMYKLRLLPIQKHEPKGAKLVEAIRDNANTI